MIRYRQRNRFGPIETKLQMTPMIDIVFQLLIFFIVTLDPMDLFSRLATSRPQHEKDTPTVIEVNDLIRINVSEYGYSINGRRMTLPGVQKWLGELGKLRADTPILVVCTGNSEHSLLVSLLDLCTDLKLTNLCLSSM